MQVFSPQTRRHRPTFSFEDFERVFTCNFDESEKENTPPVIVKPLSKVVPFAPSKPRTFFVPMNPKNNSYNTTSKSKVIVCSDEETARKIRCAQQLWNMRHYGTRTTRMYHYFVQKEEDNLHLVNHVSGMTTK